MGWLDAIFGKGTSKNVRAIEKAFKPSKQKPKPVAKTARPKVTWTKSEKGNDTAEVDGWQITVFPQDGIWNYCACEILDEEDIASGEKDIPIYGDLYPTKAEAKREAIAFVT